FQADNVAPLNAFLHREHSAEPVRILGRKRAEDIPSSRQLLSRHQAPEYLFGDRPAWDRNRGAALPQFGNLPVRSSLTWLASRAEQWQDTSKALCQWRSITDTEHQSPCDNRCHMFFLAS